ncbi:MAG: porin [Thermoguttaceae bacterium]|jgi:phosphate-selective porin
MDKRVFSKRLAVSFALGVLLLYGVVSGAEDGSPPFQAVIPTTGTAAESTAGRELERNISTEAPEKSLSEQIQGDSTDFQRSIDELKAQIDVLHDSLEKERKVPQSNKKFSAKVGGLLEMDAIAIDQSRENQERYGDIDNDYVVRDLRFWVKGEGYDNLDYEVALGYAGSLSFKNVVITAKNLPILDTARIGYFKVESGMNYAQIVYDYTFTDCDSIENTFRGSRRLGIASIHYGQNKNIRLFTGIFTDQNLSIGDGKHANESNDNPGVILNTRLTAIPIYTECAEGEVAEVFHLGGGFRWVDVGRDRETGQIQETTLKASPTDWLPDMTPLIVGKIATDSYAVTNVEAGWQRGRLGLIGEGHFGTYDGYDNAYSVSTTGRFLLTPGAYQKYNKANGCFSGIAIPANMRFIDCEKWTCLEGGGVWEVAAQWAWTDLDMLRDGLGTNFYGRMHQYTVALNWYWNPQTRWGLDWIYAKPISGTGGADETASSLNTLACQVRICF